MHVCTPMHTPITPTDRELKSACKSLKAHISIFMSSAAAPMWSWGDGTCQHSTHSSTEQFASFCVSVQRDKRELKPKKPLGSTIKTAVPQWCWFTKQMPFYDM